MRFLTSGLEIAAMSPAAAAASASADEAVRAAGPQIATHGKSFKRIVARDDWAVTTSNVPVTIDVTANDTGHDLGLVDVSDPRCGVATIEGSAVVYTPDASARCVDKMVWLRYTVKQGRRRARAAVQIWIDASLGTVADGQLYKSLPSAGVDDIDAERQARGFFWVDANERGDAIGDYGDVDGSGLFVRWASGATDWIVPPTEAPDGGFALVGISGINDHGTVTGWYFNADYTVAGTFLWTRDTGSVRLPESEPLDLIANTLDNAGTVVGYTEDYDVSGWSGFVAEPGSDLSDAVLVQVPGWTSTQLFELNEEGLLMGTVSESPDSWNVNEPKTCFTAEFDGSGLVAIVVRERPVDTFLVDCRGLDRHGNVVGKFFPGTTADDRLRVHYAMRWDSWGGFVPVHFPQKSRPEVRERREELLAITNEGVLYGNVVNDSFDEQTYQPLELRPVHAAGASHLSYADTSWDEVGRVLNRE
ncbi:MAG: hypothetical protein B7733_11295 [Myxococcales bacterium FL481]|nr:MAG: hypothetical protein B7733_11295 [Myxococcales bacterium FL481]